MPAIMSIAWLSQMPVSQVRSGNASIALVRPVPSGIAAVQATTLESRDIRSVIPSAKAAVKDRPDFLISTRQPSRSRVSSSGWSTTSKAPGEWNAVASPSLNA